MLTSPFGYCAAPSMQHIDTTPVAVIENATLPGERWHLGTLRELGFLAQNVGAGPALIVLGEVLRERAQAESSIHELLQGTG